VTCTLDDIDRRLTAELFADPLRIGFDRMALVGLKGD